MLSLSKLKLKRFAPPKSNKKEKHLKMLRRKRKARKMQWMSLIPQK